MELSDLKCRQCGASIARENILPVLAMASCAQCGAVAAIKGLPAWFRQSVPLPEGMRVDAEGGDTVISYVWYSPKYYALGFLALVWVGVILAFGSFISATGGHWFIRAFLLLPMLPGLGLGYISVAGLFNTTRIRAGRKGISITIWPIPYLAAKSLAAADVQQVFTRQSVLRGQEGDLVSYEVIAGLADGSLMPFGLSLDEAPQALFIEQQVEKALGIRDVPMPGEIPRSGM